MDTKSLVELTEKCDRLEASLEKHRKMERSLRWQVEELQEERKEIVEEASRHVINVQSFWKDKIYNERCRSGTIV